MLFEKLKLNFKLCGSFVNRNVDEYIIPYYRKHDTKQFIRGRPVRFGFKIWRITSSEEYLLHAELYCGAGTDLPDTTLPLLDELAEIGIGGLSTLQQNRFHSATVANKTALAKKRRGFYDFAANGKYLVVPSLDNKAVTCTTNYVTHNPVSTAQPLSKSAKIRVDVPMLKPFVEDNIKGMVAVD